VTDKTELDELAPNMGMASLCDVLRDPYSFERDMVVYVRDTEDELGLQTEALVLQHGSHGPEDVKGYRYLLEIGVIQEVLEGLRDQLEKPEPIQCLRAILYYAEHDAYPDIDLIR
jgi:hypothetical protein